MINQPVHHKLLYTHHYVVKDQRNVIAAAVSNTNCLLVFDMSKSVPANPKKIMEKEIHWPARKLTKLVFFFLPVNVYSYTSTAGVSNYPRM